MCNPFYGEPFKRDGETLIGAATGKRYPIRDGIPVILEPSVNRRQTWYSQLAHEMLAFAYDPILRLGDKIKINTEKIVRVSVIQNLEVKPGEKVLETAIGSGVNIPYLPDHGDYYGVDLSYPLLRRAQKKLAANFPNLELFQADGAYLPFRDDTFDQVFNMGGIQFYADPFRGVSEMARVARPGTTITVIDEISGAIRTLKRLPAHRRYSISEEKALEGIIHLVPHSMQEKACTMIPDTDFYQLTFKKPDFLTTQQL
ncbi:MAG: methyltransferase domain-containing protein [Chloroflexota bacterium]